MKSRLQDVIEAIRTGIEVKATAAKDHPFRCSVREHTERKGRIEIVISNPSNFFRAIEKPLDPETEIRGVLEGTVERLIDDCIGSSIKNELFRRYVQAVDCGVEFVRDVTVEVDFPDFEEEDFAFRQILSKAYDNLSEEDLDDMVHDLASGLASRVNNDGLDSQVKFLIGEIGTTETKRFIEAKLKEKEK